ncbi:hypothetical protein LUZ60_005624 [Juncus effusus]|nr:hypothetical protein LUZ60_005624 [Juncus effusus]
MSSPLTARASFLRLSGAAQGRRRRVGVACSVTPPPDQCVVRSTRRSLAIAGVVFSLIHPNRADAAMSLDKYVKRKKLEPLEAYVPAVLLSQDQFKDLEKSLEVEEPKYDESRSLLRSGPAGSLRINIRAVAQYANDSGKGKVATDAVDQCLRALEDLDSLLLRATRKDRSASAESMKGKIVIAIGALDNLLQTVPLDVLDKANAIADAYRTPSYEEQISDPEMKKLESIL